MADSLEDFSGGKGAFGAPLPPSADVETLLQAADAARSRQVWEQAISLYEQLLLKNPSHVGARLSLGACYEAKSREPGLVSFLEKAADEYKKVIAADPALVPAHDALLALMVKKGDVGPLLDDYRSRLAAEPGNALFKEMIRKIQALLLLQTEKVPERKSTTPPLLAFLFGLVSPGVGLLSLVAYGFLKLKGSHIENADLIGVVLLRVGMAGIATFLSYKVFQAWRSAR